MPFEPIWLRRASWTFVGLLLGAMLSDSRLAMAEGQWRWKFTAGEELAYEFQQQSQTETKGAGKPSSAIVKMSMQVSWKVEKVDEQGGATITQTIKRLSATLQVDKLDAISYDSATPSAASGPAREIADAVKSIVGAPFTVQLNARGEVSSVEPSDGLRDALEKAKANPIFSADGLLRVIRQASFVVPEQAVAADASWETISEAPSPLGQLEQTSRYTYAGPAEREGKTCEKVDVDTKLTLRKSNDAGAPVVIKESEQRGTLWFDAAAGRLAASEVKQRLVTERPYREMIIRVQTTSTMEMKLVNEE